MEAAKQITQEGFSRRRRLHIHFYECNRHGDVMGGNSVRCGSDVAIVISARQRIDGGIVCYRSANNVVLSEGIDGIIGPQDFRFTQRRQRGPYRRRILLRHMTHPVWVDEIPGKASNHDPRTMITQKQW